MKTHNIYRHMYTLVTHINKHQIKEQILGLFLMIVFIKILSAQQMFWWLQRI